MVSWVGWLKHCPGLAVGFEFMAAKFAEVFDFLGAETEADVVEIFDFLAAGLGERA